MRIIQLSSSPSSMFSRAQQGYLLLEGSANIAVLSGCVDLLNCLSIRIFFIYTIKKVNYVFWNVIFELETLLILMWIGERGTVNNRLASNNIYSFFAIMLLNKMFVWCVGYTWSGTKTYSLIRLMSCHKDVIGCERDIQRSENSKIFLQVQHLCFITDALNPMR